MTTHALIERLNLLQSQNRWPESKQLLESYLADDPQNWLARLYYVNTLLNLGEKKKVRELTDGLLAEEPDNPAVLHLAARVELNDEQPKVAEQYAKLMLQLDAGDVDAYVLLGRIKLHQRNYDAALDYAEQALALEPEDPDALNLRIYVSSFLNKGDTDSSIGEALSVNPEDPGTIANHGLHLLRQGKVNEALERLQYALSLDPTNELARFVMLQALRARFLPYRLYFKYQQAMARLSGGASMAVIIGLWVGVQLLQRVGRSNPDLAVITDPLVYVLVGLFILTWIIDPLMNFYLLTNRYGRLLLDDDDKLMARLTGGSLGLSVLCLLGYLISGGYRELALAAAFLLLTIPLGSFLRPFRKSQRQLTTAATVGIAVLGLGGILLDVGFVVNLALFGLLGYQFLLNGIMVKEGGRTFD